MSYLVHNITKMTIPIQYSVDEEEKETYFHPVLKKRKAALVYNALLHRALRRSASSFNVSRPWLSDATGLSRQTVSRLLTLLKKSGLIKKRVYARRHPENEKKFLAKFIYVRIADPLLDAALFRSRYENYIQRRLHASLIGQRVTNAFMAAVSTLNKILIRRREFPFVVCPHENGWVRRDELRFSIDRMGAHIIYIVRLDGEWPDCGMEIAAPTLDQMKNHPACEGIFNDEVAALHQIMTTARDLEPWERLQWRIVKRRMIEKSTVKPDASEEWL